MAECTIKERTFFEKLTKPISYEEKYFSEQYYHTLVKEAPFEILGGTLYNLLNKGQQLPIYDNYYVEWHHTEKYAHGWRELIETHTPLIKRDTGVKVGHRRQKCRIWYSASYSFYPRGAAFFPSEEAWMRQNEANMAAFARALDHYKTYIVLKLFLKDADGFKKIINSSENSKANWLKEIVEKHELKTNTNEDFYTYDKSLEERFHNWKDGTDNGYPLCIKADGTCCTADSDCEVFKYKDNPNKTILECLHKMMFCNNVSATTSAKKFLDPIADDADKKIAGFVTEIKKVLKILLNTPTTKYNLCHNAADVTKACKDCNEDCCKNLKKFGVEFMMCCCAESGANECFCEIPRIRTAGALKILINPMEVDEIDSLSALAPNFNGYKMTSDNFSGVTIVQDICVPTGGCLIFEDGALEIANRYQATQSQTIQIPDELTSVKKHIGSEFILRPSKVCVWIKKPA